ncbi:helix-turn-helix transcriptional regulator [Qipengyuania sp. 1NDH17]|uniref:Helix-turn-helix transcriptional regulator n=1 Tax=Qipengyuania polymorpha TaxID=2867234 RepID=A0ABS7J785_9SPHN|nr:helix-turn-helix transcriptional regulator [Qipengyuania polymorpha]MBX7459323.1 helix-turn-helix transcriptional regulator [Qipengyuania polymorpha]
MSTELADFLTQLHASPEVGQPMPEGADEPIAQFYRYIHALGVEHCNFGGFELAHGQGQVNEFNGSLLPEPFLEEFTEELAPDDYTLLKAGDLSPENPTTVFNIGLPFLDEIEAFNPASRRVQTECARHGIEDGIAIIGHAPMAPGSQQSRFFCFVFAGDTGGAAVAREKFGELQVAAFALMGRIRPLMDATVEGFSYNLTAREKDVLGCLAAGLQRQEIAFRYGIAVPTVDMHLSGLRKKLQAQTLAEAVAKGYRYGIL